MFPHINPKAHLTLPRIGGGLERHPRDLVQCKISSSKGAKLGNIGCTGFGVYKDYKV